MMILASLGRHQSTAKLITGNFSKQTRRQPRVCSNQFCRLPYNMAAVGWRGRDVLVEMPHPDRSGNWPCFLQSYRRAANLLPTKERITGFFFSLFAGSIFSFLQMVCIFPAKKGTYFLNNNRTSKKEKT